MSLIYQPKGRAREYCELALNVYNGCAHGCTYCYVPAVLKKTEAEFHAQVTERKDLLKNLRRELKLDVEPEFLARWRYDNSLAAWWREVLLSFTCDPYQPIDTEKQTTRRVIELLIEAGAIPVVLTKGGTRAVRDFDLLKKGGGKFGTTLLFSKDESRKKYESNAAPVEDRIQAIKEAHRRGIFTWLSLEPVIIEEEAYEVIRLLKGYISHWKVGKLNHLPSDINWRQFAENVTALLKGESCYLKNDLRAYLKNPSQISQIS